MHAEAYAFVQEAVAEFGPFKRVAEFGSRDINGSVRPLFGEAEYIGIDSHEGRGVDLVQDAATWEPSKKVDCVVCCEVFEHTPDWRDLVESAAGALRKGGVLILTMAGPGRSPHSAVDGGPIRPGEHYANIKPDELTAALKGRFSDVRIDELGTDLRATARARGTNARSR